VPAVVAHFLHNAIGVLGAVNPDWYEWIGVSTDTDWAHLPTHILVTGGIVFVLGLLVATRPTAPTVQQPVPATVGGP
jgi:hypothetical protein